MMKALVPLVVHLRLPFQIALSVIFLWGVFLASGRFDGGTFAAWLAFTVGLSGGATAFNSCYDRDRGPVGGLREPPPVTPSLLPFSLAVQAAGFAVVLLLVSLRVAVVYLAAAVLFAAYSHPRVRTKRHPWISMLTVSSASGALMLLGGAWSAAGGIPEGAWYRVAWGIAGASLTIAGFYPLTQVGQIDEDRARGDRTFAVVYGRGASFRWAVPLLTCAGAVNLPLALGLVGWGPAAGLLIAQAVLALRLVAWWRQPELDVTPRADLLAYATAAVHLALVAYRGWTL